MKLSNLRTLLHTDIKTLLYRLCFALCPSRACWPTPDHREHSGESGLPGHAKIAEHDQGPIWDACVLWGNGTFWRPVWGHSEPPEGREAQDARPMIDEPKRPSSRKAAETSHAMGQG